MEPEESALPTKPVAINAEHALTSEPGGPVEEPYHGLRWIFIGPERLRAGWSVLVFLLLFIPLTGGFDAVLARFHLISKSDGFSPKAVFFGEAGALLAFIIAIQLVGLMEGRSILTYNLSGKRRFQHFIVGIGSGFLTLSALVGSLMAGGWLHLDTASLSGSSILRFGFLWGCAFLLGGCVEEGTFRCYGLFTLARGINFWWAFGLVAVMCAYQAMLVRGTASWGVYAAALLGLFPCLALHQKFVPSGGYWYAAWVTSTLFGFVHVRNPGEAWIGIFSAAFIGFVFCVSIRITGSAWWAIGCHAAWDWGETFFYGTADSGMRPHGSYLTSTPTGNPLWSGGSVGPEGSVLVLGAILLLLIMLFSYARFGAGRKSVSAKLSAAD